jgi:hypothetical protein
MPRAQRFAVAVLLATFTLEAPARADEVDDWIEKGLQLRRQREDARAIEYFRRAYDARPIARNRVQLALAEQAVGRWIEAEADLSEALKTAGDAWIDRHRDKLAEGLETIRDHLGWLRVDAQDGVEIWLNDNRVGVLPMDGIRVIASTVQLELRGRDLQGQRQTIEVKPRETLRLIIPLAPVGKGADAQLPPAEVGATSRDAYPQPSSGRRTAGWITLGAGGLLLTQAVVAEVVRTQAVAHYNDDAACLQPGFTREQMCGQYRGRAETAQFFATTGLVAGGVAVGAGLWLLLTSRPEPPVTVTLGPHQYGLSWRGSL